MSVKAPCKPGDRIRLTAPVRDDYPPPGLPAGCEGTVVWVGQWTNKYTRQVDVNWDNGRRLALLDGDQFEVIKEQDCPCGYKAGTRPTQIGCGAKECPNRAEVKEQP